MPSPVCLITIKFPDNLLTRKNTPVLMEIPPLVRQCGYLRSYSCCCCVVVVAVAAVVVNWVLKLTQSVHVTLVKSWSSQCDTSQGALT